MPMYWNILWTISTTMVTPRLKSWIWELGIGLGNGLCHQTVGYQ